MQRSMDFHRTSKLLLPAILLAMGAACAGVHVRTDYNHRTDFARFKTYSWIKASAGSSLWADRIQRDVDAELGARGWTRVPSGGEAAVAAFGSTRDQQSLETFYNGFGPGFGGWYWGGFGGGYATTQVVNTPVGTVVVDIFNNSTRRLIWRGVAQQALSDKPRENVQRLRKAITKMFGDFPPKSQG